MTARRLVLVAIVAVLLTMVVRVIPLIAADPEDRLALILNAGWIIGIGLVLLVIRVIRDRRRRG